MSAYVCPPDHVHGGSTNCYGDHGCRCDPCRRTNTATVARWRKRVAYGRVVHPIESPEAVSHIRDLIAKGMPRIAIADTAGVARSVVTRVLAGQIMMPETAAKILALTIDDWTPDPLSIVSPLGALRRVRALACLGWTARQLRVKTGLGESYISRLPVVTGITLDAHQRIAAVFEELCMTPAPPSSGASRVRKWAQRRGWVPPLAWDDIDDPAEIPQGVAA